MSSQHDEQATRRIESLMGRPAPNPRPYFPEFAGTEIRARCVEVNLHFEKRWGREEVHLRWEALDEPVLGEVFWMKLNYPERIGQGSYYYKWYCALLDTPQANEPMSPLHFKGIEARVCLKTTRGAPLYTVVDPSVLPVLLGQVTDSLEQDDPNPQPVTRTPDPNPLPDTHDQPTQTHTHTQ